MSYSFTGSQYDQTTSITLSNREWCELIAGVRSLQDSSGQHGTPTGLSMNPNSIVNSIATRLPESVRKELERGVGATATTSR